MLEGLDFVMHVFFEIILQLMIKDFFGDSVKEFLEAISRKTVSRFAQQSNMVIDDDGCHRPHRFRKLDYDTIEKSQRHCRCFLTRRRGA